AGRDARPRPLLRLPHPETARAEGPAVQFPAAILRGLSVAAGFGPVAGRRVRKAPACAARRTAAEAAVAARRALSDLRALFAGLACFARTAPDRLAAREVGEAKLPDRDRSDDARVCRVRTR